MRNLGYQNFNSIIEPNVELAAVCENKNSMLFVSFWKECQKQTFQTVLKSSQVLNCSNISDPKHFLQVLYKLMGSGDFFIFTTLNGNGLDIACLQEKSKAVTPPQHINFFNPQSISLLLRNVGFDLVKVETPGKLDVDILSKNVESIQDQF